MNEPEFKPDERLFRFISARDYDSPPGVPARVRSSLFYTSAHTVSVNRESVWPLELNLAVAPPGWGLCSLTAQRLEIATPGPPALTLVPDPLDRDPLLGISNPSHVSFSRLLTRGEAPCCGSLVEQHPPRSRSRSNFQTNVTDWTMRK